MKKDRKDVMSEQMESIVPTDYLHDDVHAVAEYRSISSLAVMAAVIGACSLVAMVNRGLLVVPLLGVIVALFALWRISSSGGQLAGRGAALFGLAMSLLVGSGLYARDIMLDRLVAAEAQQWALEWCDLVVDDGLLTALELTNGPAVRRPFDDTLAEYYNKNDAAREALVKFREDEVVLLLSNAPDGAKVIPKQLIGVAPSSRGGYWVAQEFALDTGQQTQRFQLQVERTKASGAGGGAWYLTGYALAE